jgi:PilZ domain
METGMKVTHPDPLGAAANVERRRLPRHPASDYGITTARIRPACPVGTLNLSKGGALIEAPRRLLPGARIELQLHAACGPLAVSGIVLRCAVSELRHDSVCYRAAIEFGQEEARLSVPEDTGHQLPVALQANIVDVGKALPAHGLAPLVQSLEKSCVSGEFGAGTGFVYKSLQIQLEPNR